MDPGGSYDHTLQSVIVLPEGRAGLGTSDAVEQIMPQERVPSLVPSGRRVRRTR